MFIFAAGVNALSFAEIAGRVYIPYICCPMLHVSLLSYTRRLGLLNSSWELDWMWIVFVVTSCCTVSLENDAYSRRSNLCGTSRARRHIARSPGLEGEWYVYIDTCEYDRVSHEMRLLSFVLRLSCGCGAYVYITVGGLLCNVVAETFTLVVLFRVILRPLPPATRRCVRPSDCQESRVMNDDGLPLIPFFGIMYNVYT